MICFIINVYDDLELAISNIERIKSLYDKQEAQVFLIFDGLHKKYNRDHLLDLDVLHKVENQVKDKLGSSGLWTHRYLEYFINNSKAETLIKIDPDSKIINKIRDIPVCDLFGSLKPYGNKQYIQGGAVGFSREAVIKILESKLLITGEFINYYYRYSSKWKKPWEEERPYKRITCQDIILAEVSYKLNLNVKDWDECNCYGMWQKELLVDFDYAIVHPVY